jgi:hypothetical protein
VGDGGGWWADSEIETIDGEQKDAKKKENLRTVMFSGRKMEPLLKIGSLYH